MDDILDVLMQEIERGAFPYFSRMESTAGTSRSRWSITSGWRSI